MDSKTQKIISVAVIIIVVIAGIAIVLFSNEPETSEARAMILDANDVQASQGGDWNQTLIQDVNYIENATSGALSEMKNATLTEAHIWVYVFDNDSASHAAFLNWIARQPFNDTDPLIGNESCTSWAGDSWYVILTFRKANVLVGIALHQVTIVSWLNDSAISLAQFQLQKIDQYLAQHPGAN